MSARKIRQDNSEENRKMKLVVKTSRCPQNHSCPSIRVCPVGALSQNGCSAPVVDYDECIICGKCVRSCPKKALVLE